MENSKKCKLTIRLTNYQMQCLTELTQALETNYSLLIRTIIGDFLNNHQEKLERIISNKKK